jgi:hypothetical protein
MGARAPGHHRAGSIRRTIRSLPGPVTRSLGSLALGLVRSELVGPVEVGAKAVGQVVRLDRSAKPARVEGADDPVAKLDPRHPVANGSDLAGTVGKRHDAELCRTATAPFEDHQIAIVERARAHSHQDFLRHWPGILARSQHDPVNAAEAVDAIGFHPYGERASPPSASAFSLALNLSSAGLRHRCGDRLHPARSDTYAHDQEALSKRGETRDLMVNALC